MSKYVKNIFASSHYVILGFTALLFCLDFLDKLDMYYAFNFIKFNRILKLVLIVYSLFFIVAHLKYIFNEVKYVLYTFLILNLIFLIKFNYWDLYIDEYLRYMFILLIFPLLHFTYFNNENNLISKFYFVIKYFIIINTLVILSGIIFDITVFQSYNSYRFGYNGLLLSQGLTPYVYLCATTMFWVFKDKKMLYLTLGISILSGIKGVYFAEFLVLSLLIFYNKKYSQSFKFKSLLVLSLLFASMVIGLFNLSPFKEVINSNGILSAIFSLRNDNLIELYNEITDTNFNILIGVTGLDTVRVELLIFDIILFFGCIGLFTYIYFLISFYKEIVISDAIKVLFLTAITLSTLSGNLLYIPLSSTLFVLTLFCLHHHRLLQKSN